MKKRFSKIRDATIIELPDALEAYRRDESHIVGDLPLAAVKPRGPDALRELVFIAKGEGLNLVPRGTGTGKAGGAVPSGRSVVVDMADYAGEIVASASDLALRAPAGALLRDVKSAALAQGLFYPPDPNSWDQCSLGGSLATNAGGPSAWKYGVTRHWVLSVDALMEDGGVHRFGVDTVKDCAGPSFGQLLIGSEGIFGIITGASLRLTTAPAACLTLLLPVPTWQGLLTLPARLPEYGLLPCALEFWDPVILDCLRRYGTKGAKDLPGEALAILEFDDAGCAEEPFLERVLSALGTVVDTEARLRMYGGELGAMGTLAGYARVAVGARQRENIWDIRRRTSTVLKERFPNKVSLDVSVPRSRIADFFGGAEKLGSPIATYGHLGDGNLHVNLLDTGDPEGTEKNVHAIFSLALSLGGTLTGEHGIGLAKRGAFLTLGDPWRVDAIRRIKNALDPCGIFNVGKVV